LNGWVDSLKHYIYVLQIVQRPLQHCGLRKLTCVYNGGMLM